MIADQTPVRVTDLTIPQMVETYNDMRDRLALADEQPPPPVERFPNRRVALERVRALRERLGAAARGAGEDFVIRLLVRENPKAEGSLAAERHALYRDGMTIGAYLDACAALQGGPRSACRSDLQWDAERGFIAIQAPDAPMPIAPGRGRRRPSRVPRRERRSRGD